MKFSGRWLENDWTNESRLQISIFAVEIKKLITIAWKNDICGPH